MSNLFPHFPPPPLRNTPPKNPFPPNTPHPSTLKPKVTLKTSTPSAMSPVLPRVGGIEGGIVWTGGSYSKQASAP